MGTINKINGNYGNMKQKTDMKITLNMLGVIMAPVGMILAQFNKPVGAAILGSSITLILLHLYQHYELREKRKT